MVIVDTNFKRLQELIKAKISLKELDQILADIGMELDEVDGDEVKIEITAERTDLITPEGLARAINCYLELEKYKEIKVNKGDYVHKIEPTVKKVRAFTKSFVVKGLNFTDDNIKALMWIQEKLHDTYGRKRKKVAIGVYNLNDIKFPVIYTARKPQEIKFIPLGMNQKLDGFKILQKHPTGRNYAHLLEGQDKFPLQIDNSGQVLSMPPIINSNILGKIDENTTDIFVECTGPNEDALDSIMNILATMFNDWKGKIFSVTIKDGSKTSICPSLTIKERTIEVKEIEQLIGIKLKTKEASKLLEKMEYCVKKIEGNKITVSIPSIRTDVWHNVDLADDVARAYGYNNIELILPNLSTIGKMLPENILTEDLANFLVGLGLIEVKTFALTNHLDQFKRMNVKESKHIALGKNTEDKNLSMIRCWLMPELIKALVANRNQEYPQRIFEIGTIVIPDNKSDVKSKNVSKLVCLLCEENADFTKIRQILDSILEFIGVEYTIKETKHNSFIHGRVANIQIKGKNVGLLGEINPQVLDNWDLKIPICALEINLENLHKL
jgi:phenylalanyl-tRNA synthetase beta chain